MARTFILAAAIFGFVGVGLGAFGAHGLAATLEASGRTGTFDTATQYLLVHALALLAVALLVEHRPDQRLLRWAGWLFITGAVLFSGSLLVLAIFDLGFMGAVAPLGGAALLGGWACVGFSAWRDRD